MSPPLFDVVVILRGTLLASSLPTARGLGSQTCPNTTRLDEKLILTETIQLAMSYERRLTAVVRGVGRGGRVRIFRQAAAGDHLLSAQLLRRV